MRLNRIFSITEALGREVDAHGTGFGGAGERSAVAPNTAYNPSEGERGFDDFVSDLVSSLQTRYGLDRDLAAGLIVAKGREYAQNGRLPTFPRAGTGDTDLAAWAAAAKTSDFRTVVLQAAKLLVADEEAARSYGRRR